MDDTDDFDFTKPQALDAPAATSPLKAAKCRFYDALAAARVFKAAGREERFAAGQAIFVEDERAAKGIFSRASSRMYYLAEGEVSVERAGRVLDTLGPGEVLGEMAVVSDLPRSATAKARSACVLYSMDSGELQSAMRQAPEFGLMLASIMFDRLRLIAARIATRPMARGAAARKANVFDPQLLARLGEIVPHSAIVRYAASSVIMKEGQAGSFMYVVRRGRVAIAVGPNIVEVVEPGGTFGEMALIDQSPRTARAGTLEDSELVAIDRAALIGIVKREPAFGMAMLRGVSDRLRHMNSLLA